MTSRIQQVSKLAYVTFKRLKYPAEIFESDISVLSTKMNELSADDVNFNSPRIKHGIGQLRSPVAYIHLWDCSVFTMGIFIVKGANRLPLHDHPNMFGFIKVIYGKLKVSSFTEVNNARLPIDIERTLTEREAFTAKLVRVEKEGCVSSSDACCVLSPQVCNFHEISAMTEIAAFVDILAPPYNEASRMCNYYRTVSPNLHGSMWITRTPQPDDYWCESLIYSGPDLSHDIVVGSN